MSAARRADVPPRRAILGPLLAAAALLAVSAGPAGAQDAYCLDPSSRQVDQRGTDAFQQLAQQADPGVMQMLAGVWYAETRSPATNQIDYQHRSYEPGGLFRYHSRVCGGLANACSEYDGIGLYAARQGGGGAFFGMLIVSDLNRDHQCTGLAGRFADRMTLIAADGTAWRRVQ